MNKNLLKWILIAAVILGAAGYLILSETSSNNKKEQIVVGHSKPFKIEPIEGITISAPKDALDKNRKFTLTPVDDKTYNRLTKLIAAEGVTPLFVFDFDAGLKPDEYFPGDFDVEWDLDKMGIPRSLQDGVCIYRIAGEKKHEEYIKLSSRVSNGKLHFRSNQNSYWELCMDNLPTYITKRFLRFFWEYTGTPSQTLQRYFFNEPTRLGYPVQDESGDFVLYFRFRDTEVPDGFDAFVKNEKEAMARIDELEKYAEAAYNAQLKQKYQEADITIWDQMFSSAQVEAIKKSISVEQILQDTASKDPVLKKLNEAPEANLPQSILTIRDQVIRANQYLNSIGLHHQDFELPVYLVNDDVMTQGIYGAAKKYNGCGDAFMLVNYTISRLNGDDNTVWEKMQCTLVHELCHVRQQCYYAYIMMNGAPAEGSVVVLERDAAKLWFKNGIIKTNPNTETGLKSILTGRDDRFIFSFPLDQATSSAGSCGAKAADWAYTIGDAIEGIRKGVGKESVNMKPFMDKYSFSGPHVKGWTGWIKASLEIDDKQLAEGWMYYSETMLGPIYASQYNSNTPQKAQTITIKLAPGTSIAHLESLSKPRDYSVNTFRIELPSERVPGKGFISTPGNVFVYSKGNSVNPYLTIYLSNNGFVEYDPDVTGRRATPSMYCEKNDAAYMLAAVATCQSKGEKCDYYVAALFPPTMPIIKKVKNDVITFEMPDPPRDMKKAKLITGAVITYKDNNGIVKTRDVEPKYFGKKMKWTITDCSKNGNGFTLSAHWYYKPDEKTTYVSPESEIAHWGAKGDEPKEEAKPVKEPKTNYWKQVNAKMNVTNSSFKEEYETVEEVYPDYRSIGFEVDKTEKSCDFSGMAATEEALPDGKTRYVRDLYMTGTLTYTEPPMFWIPAQQYKARWEIADDPYVMKINEPFAFMMQNTSSNQAACTQSKTDRLDTGRSTTGKVEWLRGATTTFEARHPEKDGPKFFTLTQTYSIKEREGSNKMATVTFVYDYEWVGEPEKEEKIEEETAPEGGYWLLVKTEVDDSHASFKDELGTTSKVNGGTGSYSVHSEWWDDHLGDMKYELWGVCDGSIHFDKPKSIYRPNEFLGLNYTSDQVQLEGKRPPDFFFPHGIAIMYDMEEKVDGKSYSEYIKRQQPASITTEGNQCAPDHYGRWQDGMKICEVVVGTHCWVITTYYYEWVNGDPKTTSTEELDFDITYLFVNVDPSQFYTEQDKANYQGVFGIGGVLFTQFSNDKGEISVTSLGDKWFQVSAHTNINEFDPNKPKSQNLSVNVVLKFRREVWGLDQITGNYSYTKKELVQTYDKGGTKYTVMDVQAGAKFGPGKLEGYQSMCSPPTENMHANFSFEQKVGKEMIPRKVSVNVNHQECVTIDMRRQKKNK